MENDQANAGRDGRSRLARPNAQARTGAGKYSFSLNSSADHEQDWQPYPVDPSFLLYVMTITLYIVQLATQTKRGPTSKTTKKLSFTFTSIREHRELIRVKTTSLGSNYSTVLQHAHFIPIVWVWKREAHINWSMVTCQGSTRLELL